MLWIFFLTGLNTTSSCSYFAPLPAFTRFHYGKRLFNGRHSLGWAFYSNRVPFLKKIEAEFLVTWEYKARKMTETLTMRFYHHHSKRTEFTFGPHPIFSVDLSAEKVSRTIICIGFSAEVKHSTREQWDTRRQLVAIARRQSKSYSYC